MIQSLRNVLAADRAFRQNLVIVSGVIAAMNVGAWLWAFIAFAGQPVLIGVGVVVYGLGLRHAVDADHIAAIDNVTRKLLQDGRRSASIGLWFALGHSTVILLATAGAVAAAGSLNHLQAFRAIGGIVSTAVSGLFLLLVAAMNICILLAIIRTVRRVRAGHAVEAGELDTLFAGNGLLSRLARPLFRCVSRPWHMALLGFLFGLSFDTASEVALFGISATQVAHGVSFGSALVYPALFAAGMSLLDTTDGVMMVGAYHWAVADPLRKLYYNMTITLLSIAVALFIGIIELSGLAVRWFGLTGTIARGAATLINNLDYLGIAIVAVFALAWMTSVIAFRLVGRGSRLSQAKSRAR
ncbi:HoxN/HupN/NixA family nickel/cobalt transporter [Sphingomonas sp. AR_OL41]|uniref:HoxN/HupN/NixA family nickel/cobalt transporter n=1 Tax=Sphingomonas sp. AR_OL41 TaxID=3042729 RepID=UPI002480BF36|nr:HoxN/HupN/NixA family nickel/cobalt transporter [Sphingomonas sp. AR_OL41]MDH7972834.1 HoxN/HupN/NixA family nickel/cobalt transporter [Sphingomonas sp. AR_OL41]